MHAVLVLISTVLMRATPWNSLAAAARLFDVLLLLFIPISRSFVEDVFFTVLGLCGQVETN